MFFPLRWEEEEAGVLAPAVKNFTSRSHWVTSVTTLYVPYVKVQHRQLGVGGLLGVKLLHVQTTVIYMSAGKAGLVTLTFGGLFLTQPLGVDVVTTCRYRVLHDFGIFSKIKKI